MTLPSTRAGTARLRLAVPGDAAEVRLSHGVVTSRRREGEATVIEATLAPGTAAELSWRVREPVSGVATAARVTDPSDGPVRVVSDVSTLVTLGDTDVRVAALVTLAVTRGALERCTIDLPAGFRGGGAIDDVDAGSGPARSVRDRGRGRRHALGGGSGRRGPFAGDLQHGARAHLLHIDDAVDPL